MFSFDDVIMIDNYWPQIAKRIAEIPKPFPLREKWRNKENRAEYVFDKATPERGLSQSGARADRGPWPDYIPHLIMDVITYPCWEQC